MSNDPRVRLRAILTTVSATEDDDATPATIQIIYEGGPETLRHLFYTVGADAVISLERHTEQESGDGKRLHDDPIRYTATIGFSVNAVDKTGITATKLLNKIRLSVIARMEANSQSADYTWILRRDEPQNMRIGGLDPLWQDHYTAIQRPMTDT